jgi:DNA-binding transcriptional LysR family regulator
MELRVLRYFLTVAQEGNITNAATRLHVGQPTLSRQLKELEQELGQKLFVRQAHGIRLTGEGQLLRQYAQEMVEISDKIDHDFTALRTKPLGDIYVGGIDASLVSGAKLMCILREERPDLIIHFRSCCSSDALELLDRGLLDFAIVSQLARVAQYETLRIAAACRWAAVMRRDNPLAQKATVTAQDLERSPLLMHDQALRAPHDLNNLAQWFGGDFSHLNVVATSNLSAALYSFAGEGMGVLLTWGSPMNTKNYNIVSVPLEPTIEAWALLVWHKDRPLSPAAACALDIARAKMRGRNLK